MTNVVQWPAHMRARCKPRCEGCCLCQGGLFSCTRCGGGEASLPTDCPGVPMTEEQQDGVMAGLLDYLRDEGWVFYEGPAHLNI